MTIEMPKGVRMARSDHTMQGPPSAAAAVSLVCTVYNERGSILNLLQSVANGSVIPDEIIIVDGGSTDDTAAIIQRYAVSNPALGITLIRQEERVNIARGRNIAVKAAKHQIIAVTDGGCIVHKRWLQELTGPLIEDKQIDVVGGWTEPLHSTPFEKMAAEAIGHKLDEINRDKFLPSSRSVAFRKACWERVGGYPEHLTLCGEDTLFDLNMRRKGCRFLLNPRAIVHWRMRPNIKLLLTQYYLYGVGDGEARLFAKKYLMRIVLLFAPVLMVFTKRKFKQAGIRYLIYWAVVLGWIKGTLSLPKKQTP